VRVDEKGDRYGGNGQSVRAAEEQLSRVGGGWGTLPLTCGGLSHVMASMNVA